MQPGVEEWARRFRARADAVVASPAGTPEEMWSRELQVTSLLGWVAAGLAAVLAVVALLAGGSWWPSLAAGACGLSFVGAHRRARRRGGPAQPPPGRARP